MSNIRKIRCKVEHLIEHGSHVYTLDLVPEIKPPAFQPGQFLHLALDEYDPSSFWPDSRVFSIASSPLKPEFLRITYSVRGKFTARMEKELKEGRSVWIKLPYGEFVIRGAGDVVLFAGGTGITAFTAFIESLKPIHPGKVYLAYGARQSNLLIYRELVERCTAEVPQFVPQYFVEEGAERKGQTRLEVVGRLSVAALWNSIENPQAATYYISGPPIMIKTITQELKDCGIRLDAIRTDAWE